jgi:hypothetical protein
VEAGGWIALLGGVLGVVVTLALKFLGKKRVVAPPPAPPAEVANTATAEVHAAAAENIAATHAEKVAAVKDALATKKPASALAALFKRGKK